MSIRDDFFAAQAKASLWDVAVSIKRGNPLPLDANAVYKTLGVATVNGETTTYTAESLLEYAKTNPVAYPGQVCAVVEADSTTIYYLDQNLDVKPVGVIPTGDNKTIEVTADGQISLFGAKEALAGQQPRIVNKGTTEAPKLELEWYTPDSSTVAGLQETVGSLKETVDGIVDEEGKVTKEGLTHKVAALEGEVARVEAAIPTNNNQLENGAGYQTASDVETTLAPYAKTADVNKTLASYATKTYVDGEIDKVEETLATKAAADDLTALQNKVDAFLDGTGATTEAIDTLQELLEYIDAHDAVELAADIEALEQKVVLGNDAEGKEYTTVKAYVEAAIAALKIGDYAKAADLTALAGRVKTLEEKPFDTYATKDEVNAKADASALNGYYTKDEINNTLDGYVTTGNFNDSIDQLNNSIGFIQETYATKKELSDHADAVALAYATKKELSDHADAAALAYATKEELNAHKQTAESTYAKQGDSYLKAETYAKTETYSKTEIDKFLDDVTGGSTESAASVKRALDAYIQNIDTELYGAETVNGWKDAEGNYTPKYASDNSRIDINKAAIDENAASIAALELAINGKPESGDTPPVLGLAGRLAAIEAEVGEVANSRIDALAGVTAQHTTDISANTTAITNINTVSIPALEAAIAAEAKAREDADKAINEKIGTVEEGKTVVEMINAVAGKIDFSPYATKKEVSENYATIAALEAIYKVTGEGESAVATGALATEIARATAAEKSLDDAIKLLTDGAGTSEIDSVKELIDYVNNHGATVEGINDRLDGHDTLLVGIGGTDQPSTVVAAIEAAKNEAIAAIPALAIADANTLGGVKSATDVVNGEVTSVATNKVYVDATSAVGEVKAISTDILVNGLEELILFGGNAGVNA